MKHFKEMTEDEMFEREFNHLNEKFGSEGYAKCYIKDEEYEAFLNDMKEILSDIEKYKEYYVEITKE